jgi:hypothetical protein
LIRQTRDTLTARKREPNGVEPDFTEDEIRREQLGARGVPGVPDPPKMTPQREKTPRRLDPGHTSRRCNRWLDDGAIGLTIEPALAHFSLMSANVIPPRTSSKLSFKLILRALAVARQDAD